MGTLCYPNKTCFSNQSNKIKILTFFHIEQAFKKYTKENGFNIQSFNESLNALFTNDQIPQLAYTHLANRLFALLDIKQTGTIDLDSFSKGICMALSSPETRFKILFEATKLKQAKTHLDYDELYEFYLNSWTTSFDYIYKYINYFFKQEFIQNNIPFPSNSTDFIGLIAQQKDTLHNHLVQSLHDCGINYSEQITFDLFKVWATKDNTLEINYGNKWFRFAMNVNYLEVIGLNITK